jgi:adenosylcobinamide kinase/adenosylcobinamide-phosphate guanylyltransferase
MALPNVTLVLGAAASGKSSWAEHLVISTGKPKIYVATAQVWDTEVQDKVTRHKAMRGTGWITIEEPFDAAQTLIDAPNETCVLLDCATMWLTNHLLAKHDLAAQEDALMHALATCKTEVVIVSNEVGAGIVPENALSRQFRDVQGRLNQRIAAQANRVVTVIAGLPMVLKGQLPNGMQ